MAFSRFTGGLYHVVCSLCLCFFGDFAIKVERKACKHIIIKSKFLMEDIATSVLNPSRHVKVSCLGGTLDLLRSNSLMSLNDRIGLAGLVAASSRTQNMERGQNRRDSKENPIWKSAMLSSYLWKVNDNCTIQRQRTLLLLSRMNRRSHNRHDHPGRRPARRIPQTRRAWSEPRRPGSHTCVQGLGSAMVPE